MNQLDLVVAEIASLKQRVADLEKAAFAEPSEYVEGWSHAAKIVGVSVMTCRKRSDLGEFPKPCRTVPFYRKSGDTFHKPVWRRNDLIAYAEGRLTAR